MFSSFINKLKNHINLLFGGKPFNLLIVVLVAFISYGGLIFSKSVNNDHCLLKYSDPLSLIQQNRWGRSLLAAVGLLDRDVPVWSDALGLVVLVFASFVFSFLWKEVSKGFFSEKSQIVFIAVFLSYPLAFEIMVYPTSLLTMGICYLITGSVLAIIFCTELMPEKKSILFLSFCLSVPVSCYESFLFVYILGLLLCVYIIHMNPSSSLKEYRKQFVVSLFILGLALAIRSALILGIRLTHLDMYTLEPSLKYPNKDILWFSFNILLLIKNVTVNICRDYLYKGMAYFAIFVFDLSLCIFFIITFFQSLKQKKVLSFILFFGIFFVLFGLSILQGIAQIYRVCQTFPVFVAFVLMLFHSKCRHQWVSSVFVSIIVLFQMKEICLWQDYDIELSNRARQHLFAIERDLRQIPEIEKKDIIVLRGGDPRTSIFSSRIKIQDSMIFPPLIGLFNSDGENVSRGAGLLLQFQFCRLLKQNTGWHIKSSKDEELEAFLQANNIPSYPQQGYYFLDEEGRVIVNLMQSMM